MAAPTWEVERVDVLRSLALLEQLGTDTRGDIAVLGDALTLGMGKLADRDAAQQENIDALKLKVATNGVRSDGHRTVIDDLDSRVDEIEKLMPTVRIVMWVGAILGASVVALIWSVITGQAQIVF